MLINTPWRDARLSASVECSAEVAEKLRLASLDGLLALPRVGIGIGGLLFGSFADSEIIISDAIEIPCAHSNGPSFRLSETEIETARELAAGFDKGQLVGVYFSRTRGSDTLNDRDQGLYEMFCPSAWQVMLLLRPSTVEPSRAVLFGRDGAGEIVSVGDRILDPPRTALAALEAAGAIEHEPVAESAESASPAILTAPPPERKSPAEAPPPGLQQAAAAPVFAETPPPVAYPWLKPGLKWAVAVALLASVAIAWFTRYSWIPRPPLALTATDAKGHLSIRWNAEAVRGLDGGVLTVADGGVTHSFPLGQGLLEAGAMGYDRKSPRVTVMLKVRETREIASFLEPLPPQIPAEPVAKAPLPAPKPAGKAK
jgi:hypothetical protein